MPTIDVNQGSLVVFNLFDTSDSTKQQLILGAMRGIIDGANYPGWRSSTLHSGLASPGAANLIQWRSIDDIRERYDGENFTHSTVPYFTELASSVNLLKTEVAFVQTREGATATDIGVECGGITVIGILGVESKNQSTLVSTMGQPDDWMRHVPGYRSHCILRSLDGFSVVNYAQWDSEETYLNFHHMPESSRPEHDRAMRRQGKSLLKSRVWNTYETVYSRTRPPELPSA